MSDPIMSIEQALSVADELSPSPARAVAALRTLRAVIEREQRSTSRPQHGDDAGEGLRYVMCTVGFGQHYKNWLLIPHANGGAVTAAKLDDFSMATLRAQLAGRDSPSNPDVQLLTTPGATK